MGVGEKAGNKMNPSENMDVVEVWIQSAKKMFCWWTL
jgi:hypothetical protein